LAKLFLWETTIEKSLLQKKISSCIHVNKLLKSILMIFYFSDILVY